MAQISIANIEITPASFVAGGPVEVEVSYTITFTPLEMLLANYGLTFNENILLYDVDVPAATIENDDYLNWLLVGGEITVDEIASAVNNQLPRVHSRIFDRPDLRGPNDDGSEFVEGVRALIEIVPNPAVPMIVSGGQALSDIQAVNTQGPTIPG